ncbi:Crp/Fnr family transcriptional regulator [Pedobacter ureilyticus]|uniref:Crp/Fnr family transcriptional regulator n=1 Tax=Pedobacter ureilyticus TaxID=1393051 RepID=A0ABW9JBX1_9SPHI|nr:Crp/Fnr family transcriptional regulator [Pedobacter helvus]
MERKLIAQHIQRIAQCDEEDSRQFAELFKPYAIKKWGVMEVGQSHFRSMFFVYSGMLKLSHSTIDTQTKIETRTKTLGIYQPNDVFFFPFGNDPESVRYSLHAMSPSQLFVADYSAIESLIKSSPNMIRHYLSLGEHYVKQTFHHVELLQQATAQERYEKLKRHFGKHFFLIPSEYKASYMGISRKHLSRINNAYLRKKKEVSTGTDQ